MNMMHISSQIWRLLTAMKYWSFRHFGSRNFAFNLFALKLACKRVFSRDQLSPFGFTKKETNAPV